MTSSKDLGEITLSTFRGENGPLIKEVNKVVDWFKKQGTPDVILLSIGQSCLQALEKRSDENSRSRFLGFLQGEDSLPRFLAPGIPERSLNLLAQDVARLDGCIAPKCYSKTDGGATQDPGRLRSISPQRNHLWFLSAEGCYRNFHSWILGSLTAQGLDHWWTPTLNSSSPISTSACETGNRRRDDRGRQNLSWMSKEENLPKPAWLIRSRSPRT